VKAKAGGEPAARECIGSATLAVSRANPIIDDGYAEICQLGGSSTVVIESEGFGTVEVFFVDYGPTDELIVNGSPPGETVRLSYASFFGGSKTFTVKHGYNINDYPAGYEIFVTYYPWETELDTFWQDLLAKFAEAWQSFLDWIAGWGD
jgi:hypothetical protein